MDNKSEIILEVKDLKTYFHTYDGILKAVDGLSYNVRKGECIGIVGESACGKSVSAMSILRLIPYPPGIIEGGQIIFKESRYIIGRSTRFYEIFHRIIPDYERK